jgi:hypothetical protein
MPEMVTCIRQTLAPSFSEDAVLQETVTKGTASVLVHNSRIYKPC